MKKLRWGVLSTARIGIEKVIPAMQSSLYSEVHALASRDAEKAEQAAKRLKIPKFYGSYEALLADRDIDAVYISLPNHLHVPWSIRALASGKHVLCEKPIGLNFTEAEDLRKASQDYPSLKIMEAFMYKFHPQWILAKQWVDQGEIGSLQAVQSVFAYHNTDPANIRNKVETGGGGLMDIGCYNISLSRFLFGREPSGVTAFMKTDPVFKTDSLASGILEFQDGFSQFTCATQLFNNQKVNLYGNMGRIEIEIPFNVPNDRLCGIRLYQASGCTEKTFDVCDQYTLQADGFSLAVLNNTPVPYPLNDAAANMKVIDAIRESARTGRTVTVSSG